jgi:hypothetical protein
VFVRQRSTTVLTPWLAAAAFALGGFSIGVRGRPVRRTRLSVAICTAGLLASVRASETGSARFAGAGGALLALAAGVLVPKRSDSCSDRWVVSHSNGAALEDACGLRARRAIPRTCECDDQQGAAWVMESHQQGTGYLQGTRAHGGIAAGRTRCDVLGPPRRLFKATRAHQPDFCCLAVPGPS